MRQIAPGIGAIAVLGIVLAVIPAMEAERPAAGQGQSISGRPAEGFEARAKAIVQALSSLGPRPVGSANESRAAAYVVEQFTRLGIPSRLEPFDFETFEARGVELRMGSLRLTPACLGLDPYGEPPVIPYAGGFLLLAPRSPSDGPSFAAVEGKVIVTSEADDPSLHFRLSALRPKLIIYLLPEDFERIRAREDRELSLAGRGQFIKRTSVNVIARLGPNPPAPQVVIGAHMDAYRDSPGASDNASGIAALLALARIMKSSDRPEGFGLTFVAFGGEEAGVLGSRAFVERHREDLKDCRLAIVFDDLGGEGPLSVERLAGPPTPAQESRVSRIPADYRDRSWEGLQSRWRLLPPPSLFAAMGAVRHPLWLVESVDEAVKESDFKVAVSGIQGSDGLSFNLAGVPAVGISAPNGRSHTRADTPENVCLEGIRRATAVALRIVRRAPARSMEK
jgi:hypothetical protein